MNRQDSDIVQHEHLTRQLDIIPMDKLNRYPIHIIGCGAIGSFAALALAKMGCTRLKLYDMDNVDIVNMSNQFFPVTDIGTPKAQALSNMIKLFTGQAPWYSLSRVEPVHVSTLDGIVIMAVDSMDTRKQLYLAIRDMGFNVKYIIDPRMSAEFYTQYTINPFDDKDQGTYMKVLQPDSESVQERCTAKSTIYTATLAAGMVCKTVKDLIIGGKYPRVINWDISSCANPMVMSESAT